MGLDYYLQVVDYETYSKSFRPACRAATEDNDRSLLRECVERIINRELFFEYGEPEFLAFLKLLSGSLPAREATASTFQARLDENGSVRGGPLIPAELYPEPDISQLSMEQAMWAVFDSTCLVREGAEPIEVPIGRSMLSVALRRHSEWSEGRFGGSSSLEGGQLAHTGFEDAEVFSAADLTRLHSDLVSMAEGADVFSATDLSYFRSNSLDMSKLLSEVERDKEGLLQVIALVSADPKLRLMRFLA